MSPPVSSVPPDTRAKTPSRRNEAAIFDQQVEEIARSGRYISPVEIKSLVSSFLKDRFPSVTFVPNQNAERIFVLRAHNRFLEHVQGYMTRNRYPTQLQANFMQKAVFVVVIVVRAR